MPAGKYRLLIFDLDGTLVDSQHDLAAAVNHVRVLFGHHPLDLETIRTYVGSGVKVLVDRALPALSARDRTAALKEFKDYYEKHLLDATRTYPGIPQVLAALSDKTKAVLTNKTESFSRRILEDLGLAQSFVLIWGGDTGPKRKPDPEPLLEILAKTDSCAGEAVMIGDGVNDILAAKAARVGSIALGYGYSTRRELLELHPDHFAETPEDILSLVR